MKLKNRKFICNTLCRDETLTCSPFGLQWYWWLYDCLLSLSYTWHFLYLWN